VAAGAPSRSTTSSSAPRGARTSISTGWWRSVRRAMRRRMPPTRAVGWSSSRSATGASQLRSLEGLTSGPFGRARPQTHFAKGVEGDLPMALYLTSSESRSGEDAGGARSGRRCAGLSTNGGRERGFPEVWAWALGRCQCGGSFASPTATASLSLAYECLFAMNTTLRTAALVPPETRRRRTRVASHEVNVGQPFGLSGAAGRPSIPSSPLALPGLWLPGSPALSLTARSR